MCDILSTKTSAERDIVKHDFELLYFRHSIAEEHNSGGDRERALTPKGIDEMRRAARVLAAIGIRWDLAFTSGYVRSVQTHREVAQVLGMSPAAEVLDLLIPAADPRQTAATLSELGRERGETIAAFGHNPSITSAVSHLLGGEGQCAYLNIGRGDLVHLRVMSGLLGRNRGPCAVLLGFYPRKVLLALGGTR